MAEASVTVSRSLFKPYLALGCGIICLGFSGIFVSWANTPGTVTGFYRMGIAAVILAIPFFCSAKQVKKSGA
jgi:hypothetical protein